MESTQSAPTAPQRGLRPMSMAKYVKRVGRVFKKNTSTEAAASPPTTASAVNEPAKDQTTKAEAAPALPASTTATRPPSSMPTTPQCATTVPTKQIDRMTMQQERARALFAKYGLTFESHQPMLAPPPYATVQRIERPVRMRVHRNCHRCGNTFGADRMCLHCEHNRCKKCPRFPNKKIPEKEGKTQVKQVRDVVERPRKKKLLTMTTRTGAELTHQPPKQRVKRSCHNCKAAFVPPTATVCGQCTHVRCTKCPRDPAKLTKWSSGYPGDVAASSDSEVEMQSEKCKRMWRKPRARIHWQCDQCSTVFVTGSRQCAACNHKRCDKCTRTPGKKAKREEQFDPVIVAAVEERLAALAVSDDTDKSGAELS